MILDKTLPFPNTLNESILKFFLIFHFFVHSYNVTFHKFFALDTLLLSYWYHTVG